MATLFLCGAGNPQGVRLALEINRQASRWSRVVLLDDDRGKRGCRVQDVEVVGSLEELRHVDASCDEVANLISRKTAVRAAVRERILQHGARFTRLIHPSVEVMGVHFETDDVTAYQNASLCADCSLGSGAVVFMNAVAGHGSSIGPCSVLAPGAVVNARVRLAAGCYVGSNASVLPDLTLGEGVTVAANSSVLSDVPQGATVIGVPGEVLSAPDASQASAAPPGRPEPGLQELEHHIAVLWQETLDVDQVGYDVNFFDTGGSSLLAAQLCERIQRATQQRLTLVDIFRFPTVRAQAGHLHRSRGGQAHGGPRDRGVRRRQARERLKGLRA